MPVSRNQPCPCGSGHKYKHCCLDSGTRSRPAAPISESLKAALTFHRAGDLDRAEALYRSVLQSQPTHFDALHLLGVLRGQRGHPGEAADLISRALVVNPHSAEGHNNLGSFLQAQCRYAEAVEALEEALNIRPDYPEALNNLGNALCHTEQPLSDAIRCYERAIGLQPRYAEAHLNLGLALLGQGSPQDAASCFRRVLELNPQSAAAHHNLGLALQQMGHYGEAITEYEAALALRPANEETHNNLGNIYRATGKLEQAVACYRRALALRPAYAEAGCNMALALSELERYDEAINGYETVLASNPQNREAQYGMARMLQQLGRFAEAAEAYSGLLESRPQFADAYIGLVGCKRMTTEDRPLLAAMATLLAAGDCDSHGEEALHFALGKAYDDLQDYGTAMAHYHKGNALHAGHHPFDRGRHVSVIDTLIRTYDRETFRGVANRRDTNCVPVFIVGMPRSGTTLVEDVLSRHRDIAAGGELEFWARFDAPAGKVVDGDANPDADATTGRYIELLTSLSRGAKFVTDKLTTNFLRLGLLHRLMPEARIIHCRRNPIDTCLSCYFTRFAGVHDYAYGLEDLTFYYEQYRRLMDHWREVLPAGSMIEVDYEDVVASPEAASRRLIEFCGLEWTPEHLQTASDPRAIRTASKWQVRQPVYTTSVERWRRYEPFVGPLGRLATLP